MIHDVNLRRAALVLALATVLVASLYVTTETGTGKPAATTTTRVPGTSSTSFSYSPAEPLRVLSVTPQSSRDNATGKSFLYFYVTFQNIADSPVYLAGGCGSSLSATIKPSPLISESYGPKCLCAEYITSLNPGESRTASTPGCWSGIMYEIVHAGSIPVSLTLSYWSGVNLQNPGSTVIEANITLA